MALGRLHSGRCTAHRLTDTSPPRKDVAGGAGLVPRRRPTHDAPVLWTNGCILLMLWALGYFAGGTVGEWVHLFLVAALLYFALGLLKAGRRLHRSHGRWAGPTNARIETPRR